MSHEMKEEQHSDYSLNASDKKSYYNSSPEKKSYNSSPERSRSKRSRREHSYSYSPNPPRSKKSRRDRSYSSCESRSPTSYKRTRYYGSREHPDKTRVLGVFGLSSKTIEDDLAGIFSNYGPLEDVSIIYDAKSGNSRGFGFIYFRYVDDASTARRKCNGMRLAGKRIRVDYSITKRAHTPTPGIYMGNRCSSRDRYYSGRHTSSTRHSSRYRRSRSASR